MGSLKTDEKFTFYVEESRICKIRRMIYSMIKPTNLPGLIWDLNVLSIKMTFAIAMSICKLLLPARKKSLIGETVLITGAGHGIGRELAIEMGLQGCIVVCWDTDLEGNRLTMNSVSRNGGEVYGFVVDVSNRNEVRETIRMMKKASIPEVTILINNAAILHHSPLLQQHHEQIEQTFQVNVLSNFWTIEALLPAMLLRDRGHIVSMSSMCGFYGVSEKVSYCASKFAVRGLMEALNEEVKMLSKNSKIHFTTIYPFYVDTGLAKDPHYRFPYIFGVVTPKYAAQQVIKAIRKNSTECSIPRCLLFLNSINRILPESAMHLILDFLSDSDRKRQVSHQ
ncbi:17-beta-hydroxysteroid dehydrogenase 13-like [Prorops nasuta]|uniref:17-beta-hydroxysteroid dehydrogenase 13-like n=1 Tax=Prorops nasuta TaxID=863751 RepID=UPI0034CE1E5B